MSRKRARTLYSTENDPRYGKYTSTMFFDSDDAKVQLSRSNNRLTFKVQRTIEQVASVKLREIVMTNTLSPFTSTYPSFTFSITPVNAGGIADEYRSYTIDLHSPDDLSFDRQNIDLLGPLIMQQVNQQRGVNSILQIDTEYDSKIDAVVFAVVLVGGATNSQYRITFPTVADAPENVTLRDIFGMFEGKSDALGSTGELGRYDSFYYTYSQAVVSNGALRLEGNNNLLMKINAIKTRSTHSFDIADSDNVKAIKSSNIIEKVNLGPSRGNIVRYNPTDFPSTFYQGSNSLSGDVTFEFFLPDGSLPRFQKGTPVQITLDVEYDDD